MENLKSSLQVPFPSAREAEIAYNSLRVDREPKRGRTTKTLSVDGNILHVTWESSEARTLRVSMNSFMDLLALVIETLDQFGPPTST